MRTDVRRNFSAVLLSLLFLCAPASAQLKEIKRDCGEAKKDPNLNNLTDCALQIAGIFSREGIRPVVGSVVPGSGFGGGGGYSRRKNFGSTGRWRSEFDISARATTKKYWEIDSNLRLSKGRAKGNIYARARDLTRLDYFGPGPESRESDLVKFHYREAFVGADISKPLAPWLDVGGAAESIWPDLVRVTDTSVRPVEQLFTEADTPGLAAQPNFLHYAAFAGVHTPGQPETRKLDYKFFYHVYHDHDEGRYSFQRFEADLAHKFPLSAKDQLRLRGRLSFSATREGQRVPFYLQETLGGSNLRGEDTLRGFRDYRFRDRNLLLLQAEYLRELKGPLKMILFYDTGKVAPSLKQLDAGRLRHTYGGGVVVVPRQLDKVLLRLYVALGSGEGSHTFFGVGDALGGRPDRLIR